MAGLTIQQMITIAMEERGWTTEVIAQRCPAGPTGTHPVTADKLDAILERVHAFPSPTFMMCLAAGLGVSHTDILLGVARGLGFEV